MQTPPLWQLLRPRPAVHVAVSRRRPVYSRARMIQMVCKLGKRIRCTERHWQSIVRKHDALAGLEGAVIDTLQHPRYIRPSKEDKRAFLYYKPRTKPVLCVVCRHLNGDGFTITADLTDRIKKGTTVYDADSDNL